MTFKTPVLKELEIDGHKVKVHAATYRQFLRATTAEVQMLGTAQLCDETCEVVGSDEPASELLTLKGVNKAISIAIGTDEESKEGSKESF